MDISETEALEKERLKQRFEEILEMINSRDSLLEEWVEGGGDVEVKPLADNRLVDGQIK